jgi:osmoprotectant transport system permease protein
VKRLVLPCLCAAGLLGGRAAGGGAAERSGPAVVVGSKAFTESVILGEVAARLVQDSGQPVEHRRSLGGTRILWNALLAGDLDVYPDYTGTLREEILAGESVGAGQPALEAALRAKGVRVSRPLGFNDTYALGMKREKADLLGITSIGDLARHPELVFGFSNEFMDRTDGWPGLRVAYGLTHERVQGLDHDLAYRGLAGGSIDVTDLYSTDAEIAHYDIRVLTDDRGFFPEYQAVWVFRSDLEKRSPAAVEALLRMEGAIDEAAMIGMNRRARIDRVSEQIVAADFLANLVRIPAAVPEGRLSRFWKRTREHLSLVGSSLLLAVLTGIPLGILSARKRRAGQLILGTAGVIQTVPSLALLVFMIPWLGIGTLPAIVALFLYSLLPIVRNTATGLTDIPLPLRESAAALGLTPNARLFSIELPMASRAILAGIKTSAVINIGTATLGALIGAGGYGQPILTGIRLDDIGLILEGAVPAALLALLAVGLFETLERFFVPKGLRLKGESW